MGCAGSSLNKSLRAELEGAGEVVVEITFGLASGGCMWKGLESKGATQWKGNCVLAMTKTRLVSRPVGGSAAPSFEVALANVTGASLTKQFPGGVDPFDSVKVDFKSADGSADAVYYMPTVGTAQKWADQINAAKSA
jgi:hypothetical protein